MLTIRYRDIGFAVPDFACEALCESLVEQQDKDWNITISTENMLYAIRAWVAEGKIDSKKVQIDYQGEIIPVNEYGVARSIEHSGEFLSFIGNYSERIIRSATELRRKKMANVRKD